MSCQIGNIDERHKRESEITYAKVEEALPEWPPDRIDESRSSYAHAQLWHPEVPSPDLRLIRGKYERRGNWAYFHPRQLCVFGGRKRDYLPLLTRIRIWGHGEEHDHWMYVNALSFELEIPQKGISSMVLGHIPTPSTPWVESYSINVDSANGERVTAIHMYDRRRGNPIAFCVSPLIAQCSCFSS